MILPLTDAALRSLLLALAVWTGLRLFRVRSVLAQKAAWTAVLAISLLMPILLPLAARLPAATIVLPAIARRIAAKPSAHSDSGAADPSSNAPVAAAPGLAIMDRFQAPSPIPSIGEIDHRFPPPENTPQPVPLRRSLSLFEIASLLYISIAGILLSRLLYGVASAIRLWRASGPVSLRAAHLAGGLRLRFSRAVSSPVTLGSGVVLPANYNRWDEEKLRIVLAHERAHIRHGDFYLQTLAGLYAALVWFSPLGWWLKRKLSDLGEAVSDHSGLEVAASCSSYAQILLEFAAAPRPTLIGVAMARPSRLSRRIERLLNPSTFRQAFSGGPRSLLVALLVPGVLFAATSLVRVQAAAPAQQQNTSPQAPPASATEPITGQSHPDDAEPAVAPAPNPVPTAAPTSNSSATPGSPVHVQVPPIHVDVPAIHVNVPAQHIDVPEIHVNAPATHVDVPARHVDVRAVHVDVPAQHIDIPARHIDVPPVHVDVPAIHFDVPASGAQDGSGGHVSYGAAGELYAMLAGFGHGLLQNAAPAATEATFDRTLSVDGKVDLSVATGSGTIHLTRGSGNQVRIHGTVRSREGEDAAQVRQIAANPPIEQTGNIIHIGSHDQENLHNISIDYQIEAPADAALKATSGSGGITDEGVGQDANLRTGSGSIDATGLQGGFDAQTGSGSIAAQNTGQGDVRAQTGSGKIEIHDVHGALHAQTGSGEIKIAGTPTTDWKLQTGSGSIELTVGNAPLTLDATTASGKISSSQQLTQTSSDRHRLHAELNGGGTPVRVSTGSGDIRIE